MKRIVFAACVMTAFSAVAQAQGARAFTVPFTVGIAGGVSLPTSNLDDAVNTGFNVGASLEFKSAMSPFGVRIEGAWDQFNLDKDFTGTDGNLRSLRLTGNAVFEGLSSMPVRPYVIGGAGLYVLDGSTDQGMVTKYASEKKFGFNVGAGVRLPLRGFDASIEARFHSVTRAHGFNFIPITFGIRF